MKWQQFAYPARRADEMAARTTNSPRLIQKLEHKALSLGFLQKCLALLVTTVITQHNLEKVKGCEYFLKELYLNYLVPQHIDSVLYGVYCTYE
jgi:hypothetical protein